MERQNPDRNEQQRQQDQQHLTQVDQKRSEDQQEIERVQHIIDEELQRIVQHEQEQQETLNERIQQNRRRQLERYNYDLETIRALLEIEQDQQDLRQQVVLIRRRVEFIRRRRPMRVAGGISTSRNNGLTPVRIEKFEHFAADESLEGEQCLVCMKELGSGTQMVRLDCYVSHYLCKICADTWFKDHKTCPTCRHEFN